jgi:hypothetical protein
MYHEIKAVSLKSVAQIVRIGTGLHTPLPAALTRFYGVLLKQMVNYVLDLSEQRTHVGTGTAYKILV